MLNKLMENKKMLVIKIIIGLLAIFGLVAIISLLDAYVFRPGTPDYATTDQVKDEPKKDSVEKKVETNEQVSAENEPTLRMQALKEDKYINTSTPMENSTGGMMKFEPLRKEYVDIVLQNKEYEFNRDQLKYPNIEPMADIPGFVTRYIDKMTNSSFAVDSELEMRYMNDSNIAGIYTFKYPDQIRPALQVWVFSKKLLDDNNVHGGIYDVADKILTQSVGENLPPVQYYKVNNSHIMFRGMKDEYHKYAGVEDVNGNVFIFITYSNSATLEPGVMASNFESFDTAGFRYIDQEKRDQIYYDIINSVSMK